MTGIYIILNNIDNRVYVGSAVNLDTRLYHHKRDLKRGKHHNEHLQNFYNKYGDDALSFEVLETITDKNILIEREQYYIDKYPNKFNICLVAGNSLNRKCSEETKLKISKSLKRANLKGIPKSEKTKLKMRKPKSIEHTKKIKEAQKKVIKKVYQFSLENKYIAFFESVSEASRQTGISRRDISANCNNRQKSAHGFRWSFTKELK